MNRSPGEPTSPRTSHSPSAPNDAVVILPAPDTSSTTTGCSSTIGASSATVVVVDDALSVDSLDDSLDDELEEALADCEDVVSDDNADADADEIGFGSSEPHAAVAKTRARVTAAAHRVIG